jgi:hypothetical protein
MSRRSASSGALVREDGCRRRLEPRADRRAEAAGRRGVERDCIAVAAPALEHSTRHGKQLGGDGGRRRSPGLRVGADTGGASRQREWAPARRPTSKHDPRAAPARAWPALPVRRRGAPRPTATGGVRRGGPQGGGRRRAAAGRRSRAGSGFWGQGAPGRQRPAQSKGSEGARSTCHTLHPTLHPAPFNEAPTRRCSCSGQRHVSRISAASRAAVAASSGGAPSEALGRRPVRGGGWVSGAA